MQGHPGSTGRPVRRFFDYPQPWHENHLERFDPAEYFEAELERCNAVLAPR
jgi:hypothetical protein